MCLQRTCIHTCIHLKCTQLCHLHTPVPIARSPLRAQASPETWHPRSPTRCSKALPAPDSQAPSRAKGIQRRVPAPIRTCAQAHATRQRCKPTSNPSETCSWEQLLLRAGVWQDWVQAGVWQHWVQAGMQDLQDRLHGEPAVQGATPGIPLSLHPPWWPRGTLGTHLPSQSPLG